MTSHLGSLRDANFPRDAEGRVYHLGVKHGEVSNRILSVGDAGRAKLLSQFFDNPNDLFITSNRGFTIYTGTMKKIPVSIIATGMGTPMMDFVVRECRAVVNGPMVVIRFGTCGTPQENVSIGSISVADQSVLIQRNPDFWQEPLSPDNGATITNPSKPYFISRPVKSDRELSNLLFKKLGDSLGPEVTVRGTNATGDSFYSSQGRHDPHFVDENGSLLDDLVDRHPDIMTLEMETFQLLHLAKCSDASMVRGAAATIVLAQRRSNEFLDNDHKSRLEREGGLACLRALIELPLDDATLMNGPECVWNQKL